MNKEDETKKISKGKFLALATLFCLLLVVVMFFISFGIALLLINFFPILKNYIPYVVIGVILLTFVLTFVIYNKAIKWAMKKWKVEER